MEFPAQEKHDKESGFSQSSFLKEFSGFTPIMFACTNYPIHGFECLRVLHDNGANIHCTDAYDNNLLHLAAMYGTNKILEYIAKKVDLNLLARNSKGETAIGICQQLKNKAGVKILEKF